MKKNWLLIITGVLAITGCATNDMQSEITRKIEIECVSQKFNEIHTFLFNSDRLLTLFASTSENNQSRFNFIYFDYKLLELEQINNSSQFDFIFDFDRHQIIEKKAQVKPMELLFREGYGFNILNVVYSIKDDQTYHEIATESVFYSPSNGTFSIELFPVAEFKYFQIDTMHYLIKLNGTPVGKINKNYDDVRCGKYNIRL